MATSISSVFVISDISWLDAVTCIIVYNVNLKGENSTTMLFYAKYNEKGIWCKSYWKINYQFLKKVMSQETNFAGTW